MHSPAISKTAHSQAPRSGLDAALRRAMDAVITPLPNAARAQIHSSSKINSLNEVILSLLQNSLDAGATKVAIEVDYHRRGCIVDDNGLGILPAEFDEDGGLGKAYRK